MNAIDTATSAINRQTEIMRKSAERVAAAGDPQKGSNVDLIKEAVTRIEATNLTKANINVIKANDEQTQALLDLFA